MSRRLREIILTDFKGCRQAEYEFSNRTLVSGANGSGKSTIFDAHMWLWTDKDSELRSNPDIRPDDGRECLPRIDEIWDIDGVELQIAKFQKKTVSKPNAQGISKVSITNGYEINNVPKTERDFKADLTDRGFDFDNFLALSHLEVFVGKKVPEMRQTLFNMAQSKSDYEVACMTDGCSDAAELLKSYRIDEITAMEKASKKKATEQLDAIPNQIIGLEKAKVDINVSDLEKQKADLSEEMAKLQSQLSDSLKTMGNMDGVSSKLITLRSQKAECERDASVELNGIKVKAESALDNLNNRKHTFERELQGYEHNLSDAEFDVQRYKNKYETAQSEYNKLSRQKYDTSELDKLKALKFDESTLVCPYCGRPLPEDMAAKNQAKWEKDHQEKIKAIETDMADWTQRTTKMIADTNETITKAANDYNSARDKVPAIQKMIEKTQSQIADIDKEIGNQQMVINAIPAKPDMSGNEKYQKILSEIADAEAALADIQNVESEYNKTNAVISDTAKQIDSIDLELAKAENNTRIDSQISDLESELKEYAQTQADADKILYELSLISKHKNELLTDEINSHFNGVKFQLFDYLKNGDCVDSCICYVQYGDEWHRLEDCANTALKTMGKIAIVDGLQKFYRQELPVFIDEAEHLDCYSMEDIDADLQLIFLKVTDKSGISIENI